MADKDQKVEIPTYFLCPISLEIMKDPVTITTGITYDRQGIERWMFSQKNNTCPVTKQVISNSELLTPNITLRRLIQSWCASHSSQGVERLPTPKEPITRAQVLKLLNEAQAPHSQIKTLKRLKSLSLQSQANRLCMERAGTGQFLASLIVEKTLEASRAHWSEDLLDIKRTGEEALMILHSLQLSESGLNYLNNNEFIESLALIMQCGTYGSRAYSIMILKSMLEVADPNVLINLRHDVFFVELAQILNDQISTKASKAALKVLISVCPWGRNRSKAVEAGITQVLIELLLDSTDRMACEMMLMALDLICQCAEGRASLLKHSAGLAIVSKKILRVSNAANESAMRVLHSIAKSSASPVVLQEMLQIGVVAKLCLVLQVNCGPKMKEKAKDMLKTHARDWKSSSCIPKGFRSSYPS